MRIPISLVCVATLLVACSLPTSPRPEPEGVSFTLNGTAHSTIWRASLYWNQHLSDHTFRFYSRSLCATAAKPAAIRYETVRRPGTDCRHHLQLPNLDWQGSGNGPRCDRDPLHDRWHFHIQRAKPSRGLRGNHQRTLSAHCASPSCWCCLTWPRSSMQSRSSPSVFTWRRHPCVMRRVILPSAWGQAYRSATSVTPLPLAFTASRLCSSDRAHRW